MTPPPILGDLRWRARRSGWAPTTFRPSEHEVAPIPDDTTARAFVEEHHYSGSYPNARRRFGLYRGPELVGVAVFSHPLRDVVLTRTFDGPANASAELGRFVLLDEVGRNGESWFLAPCLDALRREGFRGVLSFSDPQERRRVDGTIVMPGHVGTIYQASSAVYLGRNRPDTILLLPDGRAFHRRGLAKIKAGDSRWRGPVETLVAAGAIAPRCLARDLPDVDELRPWVARWASRLLRPMRHPGNHRFAFYLAKPEAKRVARWVRRAYPKRVAT